MENPDSGGPKLPVEARLVSGVFGAVFAGIGVLVISFLWLQPFGGFGSPPVFFRLFGSLIAVCFVVVGGTTLIGAISNRMPGSMCGRMPRSGCGPWRCGGSGQADEPSGAPPAGNYTCPRCGAPLGDRADVSPHGDVKCGYCNTWFNIHQK